MDCQMIALDAPTNEEFSLVMEDVIHNSSFFGGCITNPWKSLIGFRESFDLSCSLSHHSYNVLAPSLSNEFRFSAHNTDSYGFWTSISPYLSCVNNMVMLGFGGTAKAIIAEALDYPIQVYILTRSDVPTKEQFLYEHPNVNFVNQVDIDNFFEKKESIFPFLLVNATNCGVLSKSTVVPTHFNRILQDLPIPHLFFDIVHTPLLTSSMMHCQFAGIPVLGGLHMNTLQAIRAFSLVHPDIPLGLVTSMMKAANSTINQ